MSRADDKRRRWLLGELTSQECGTTIFPLGDLEVTRTADGWFVGILRFTKAADAAAYLLGERQGGGDGG